MKDTTTRFLENLDRNLTVRFILMIILPLIIFDIFMRFNSQDLPKYLTIAGTILSPLFRNLAEPSINKLKNNISTKNKLKNDKKKAKKQ